MGCLIQIIVVLICVVGGFFLAFIPGAIIGLILALFIIAKLNSL